MIENLKNINDLNIKLDKLSEDDLNKVYLHVFNSPDGELVMQDLANRCYVHRPAAGDVEVLWTEGMRAMWLSIQSRLRGAVEIKKED